MIVHLDLHFCICYFSFMMFPDIFVCYAPIVLLDSKIKYFNYCVFQTSQIWLSSYMVIIFTHL
jgi:hypothetical protein